VTDPTAWWRSAVVYQIYPRSFCDRSGDGVGDLEGVRAHLDHLVRLGVDALWLSPVYPSPMADFGYDVADYCDVDPLFGSLADLDRLVDDAHAEGLRVILDWVPNHTSDRHPWFEEARSSRRSARRDWYIWRDGDAPPNNWRAAFAGVGGAEFPPAWTRDQATGEWYLHLFLAQQPDLNWANPEVRTAMSDTLRFWLDRGVDGFRIDVVHAIGKDPALPDLPPDLAAIPMCAFIDDPRTHPLVAGIREVVKTVSPDAVVIGEIVLPSVEQVAAYYGSTQSPELDLAFNFHPLHARWDAAVWRAQIDQVVSVIAPRGWPAWALGNHDNPRQATRYGSESRARAAAVLLLTQMGTPFLFAGEELGLADADVPPERRVDPGGRDGCRAPIPWTPAPGHGWADDPWLPWPPGSAAGRDAQSQSRDPGSTLQLYRSLLSARRRSPALSEGRFEWLPAPAGVLAYHRSAGTDERLVVVNFEARPAEWRLPHGAWEVEVGTHRPAITSVGGGALDGEVGLRADEAVVLRPVSR
jgi:alpha-glucosidase